MPLASPVLPVTFSRHCSEQARVFSLTPEQNGCEHSEPDWTTRVVGTLDETRKARMTEQKLLAALAVATVGLMLVGGVAAKPRHCRKDCKQDITDCLAVVPKNKDCSGTTAEKTACRKMHAAQRKTCRRLVKLCRQQNPSMSGTCLLSSTTTSTLTTVTSTTMPPPLACGTFLLAWGGWYGPGNGQFTHPDGVATDGSGNVYVADSYPNNRIQKFDANGTFLTTWGSSGSGNGQFSDPEGVATDGSGHVYVTDLGNSRVQIFDASGSFLTMWGSAGSANGQFSHPDGVATDGTGNVYVADFDNNRIQKFACPSATTSTSTTTTMSGATTSTTGSTPMPTSTTSTSGPTSTSTASSTTSTSLHFADNGDGTVTDNQTGLIWEKKVDGHNCLHCVYDSYTWSASGPTSDGTVFTAFLTDLNGGATGTGNCVSSDGSTQIGGFNNQCDWRLPTIGEFQTIVDVSAPGCALGSPCIAPIFGPTVASYYFSASVDDTAHPNGVWGAEFFDGTEVGLNSDARIFVRAVRGPRAPSTTPRFIDNGDGTVTDHQTGLQWEQKVAGSSCLHCVNDTYAWTSSGTAPDAFRNFLNYLNGGATGVGNCTSGDGNSQIGGFENHCDWRLPTIAELRTTLDTSQGNCGGGSGACIDPTFGPTAASLYWSSTTFAGAPSVAWFVGFSNGEVFNDGKGKNLSVRAVRGGS